MKGGRYTRDMLFGYLPNNIKRNITRLGYIDNEERDAAFRRVIHSIPRGKVSTYARVAEAAGYPLYHRAVARLLRKETLTALPWQRIVGSGGEIRLKGEFAEEQRFRLRREGIRFEGERVNMSKYQYLLRVWEIM
jgi:methylated-DNA-protein-cysteine methyltransferase-like protein